MAMANGAGHGGTGFVVPRTRLGNFLGIPFPAPQQKRKKINLKTKWKEIVIYMVVFRCNGENIRIKKYIFCIMIILLG